MVASDSQDECMRHSQEHRAEDDRERERESERESDRERERVRERERERHVCAITAHSSSVCSLLLVVCVTAH